MSLVSDIYNQLRALIPTVLTEHYELVDPYDPENNSDLFNVKGWGIQIGPTSATKRFSGCQKVSQERTFTIVITRNMKIRQNDIPGRIAVEKELFEDQNKIIEALESTEIDATQKVLFDGDGGLGRITGDEPDSAVIYVETNFLIEYVDTF
jgi:hypothetical protein